MKTRLISFVSKSVDENKVNFIGVKTHGCLKSEVKIIVWSNILDIIIRFLALASALSLTWSSQGNS